MEVDTFRRTTATLMMLQALTKPPPKDTTPRQLVDACITNMAERNTELPSEIRPLVHQVQPTYSLEAVGSEKQA